MSEANLNKAYSSKLSLVEHDGRKFVKKDVDAEELQNELFFYYALKQAGLNSLEAIQEKDSLLIEFIESSTLQDGETVDWYFIFGSFVRKMHDITFPAPFMIEGNGTHLEMVWNIFIENQIQGGLLRQDERSGFSEEMSERIAKGIRERLSENFSSCSSLLHCDLHQNNVLVHNQKLFLIDKGSAIAAGDPLYDIALVAISLPGSILETNEMQRGLFKSFLNGYGSDTIKTQKRFEGYILLRALERWPNPFEQEIPDIVEKILQE